MRNADMRKPLILGSLLGMIFGVLISIGRPDTSMLCIGFPGVAAAVLCGMLEFHVGQPGWQIVVACVNGSFYAGIGALAGWVVARRREKERWKPPPMPECSICGYRWPRPDNMSCPKCGAQNAFRNWIGRCLPTYRCECGYDLTGNLSGVCPECGTAVDISRHADKPRRGGV